MGRAWVPMVGGEPSRRRRRPTVLFVDEHGWDSFFQLAAGLHRAGFRTVRVTTMPPIKAVAFLCFDRTIHLLSPDEFVHLAELLADEDIVDVQVIEAYSLATFDGLRKLLSASQFERLERRTSVVDKPRVAELLEPMGILAPPVVTDPEADADTIVAELGLPVVYKVRTGSGGDGVHVIRTRAELDQLFTDGGHTADRFFEKFIDGRHIQFAGVVSSDEDCYGVTYETLERNGYMGPASKIHVRYDPALAALGQQVANVCGIRGMINVNVIRDDEGRDWVHDVNPRVWGSFISFRGVGLDFLGRYVTFLRNGATASQGPATYDEGYLHVFPASYKNPREGDGWLRNQLRFLKGAVPYIRWVGPRYVLHEVGHEWTRRAAWIDRLRSTASEPFRNTTSDSPSR